MVAQLSGALSGCGGNNPTVEHEAADLSVGPPPLAADEDIRLVYTLQGGDRDEVSQVLVVTTRPGDSFAGLLPTGIGSFPEWREVYIVDSEGATTIDDLVTKAGFWQWQSQDGSIDTDEWRWRLEYRRGDVTKVCDVFDSSDDIVDLFNNGEGSSSDEDNPELMQGKRLFDLAREARKVAAKVGRRSE